MAAYVYISVKISKQVHESLCFSTLLVYPENAVNNLFYWSYDVPKRNSTICPLIVFKGILESRES